MTTVKVECNCGQRFAFEVEPIHGRMPAPVACPSCGADGTAAADAILARTFIPQAMNAVAPAMAAPMSIGLGTSTAAPSAARLAIATPAHPVGPPAHSSCRALAGAKSTGGWSRSGGCAEKRKRWMGF